MTEESRTPESDIREFIIAVLAEEFAVPREDSGPDVSLKSLGIDSLGGVELSLKIKKHYGVSFVAGEIGVDFTIADIAALVREKQAETEGAVS